MAAVRRIVVGVHGSLGSLQALRYAAGEARGRSVPLAAVNAWVPPGGDLAERRHPSPYLRRIWRDAAREHLDAAFDEGLGGIPPDLRVELLVVRGEAGPVLAWIASQPGDLLVIGTGLRSPIGRAVHKSAARHLLAHARCPVVMVPPSELMDELGHGLWPPRWRMSRMQHGVR